MDQIPQLGPDMIILIAFVLLAILLLGGAVGYTARSTALREKDEELQALKKTRDELQTELNSKQSELRALDASDQSYRSEVRGHFEETSEIMSELVQNYRRMYEHLAGGAERLADLKGVEQIIAAPPPEAITRGVQTSEEDLAASGADGERTAKDDAPESAPDGDAARKAPTL